MSASPPAPAGDQTAADRWTGPVDGGPFGGPNSVAQNALWMALHRAAARDGHGGEYGVYEWMDETPRTSFVVFVTDELRRMGYDITPSLAPSGGEG